MKAVILAAGKGERLWPLTESMPKVMLKIANKPILQHNLEQLSGIVDEVILVVGYLEDEIKACFGASFAGLRISYVTQMEQFGTGHAIRQAQHLLDGRFLVLMGDNLYSRDDIKACLSHELCILVSRAEDPSLFGVCNVRDGLLVDIIEKPEKPPSDLINTGLYVLDMRIFAHEGRKTSRNEFEIVDAIRDLCRKDKVSAVEASCYDYVTYPWDLLKVNESLLRRSGSVIDKTAKISKKAIIEGPVAIGKGAVIRDCVIRPCTSIGEGAVIGNFVEVKNSVIMDNTKIPHLSYIGDSVIGPDCNLGAGTSVANLRFDDRPVKMIVRGKKVDTGRRKLGCVMGAHAKTGINVSILPGAVIKPCAEVFPGSVVR